MPPAISANDAVSVVSANAKLLGEHSGAFSGSVPRSYFKDFLIIESGHWAPLPLSGFRMNMGVMLIPAFDKPRIKPERGSIASRSAALPVSVFDIFQRSSEEQMLWVTARSKVTGMTHLFIERISSIGKKIGNSVRLKSTLVPAMTVPVSFGVFAPRPWPTFVLAAPVYVRPECLLSSIRKGLKGFWGMVIIWHTSILTKGATI